MHLNSVDGSLQLAARTPCAPVGGPATIKGNTLTVGKLAVGAVGCAGDAATEQQWVVEFLRLPIEMSYSQGTLIWKNGADALSFKSK
ncbi:META domain-containing protein [Arthrobacter sp. NA-172]|uniref:META domain-containing protein n=1 Tax=Arthrobacter sp. NA-172 TaxID=3367524 RepID=UPI0037550892